MAEELVLASVMKVDIEHPYWDTYIELASLEESFSTSEGGVAIWRLARKLSFRPTELLKLSFLIACPGIRFCCIEELFFCVLRERYAYSVLSPEALEKISGFSPFVELGAGNGYVAWTLQQSGVDIVALEAYPVEEGRNWFFNTRFGLPAKGARSFTAIRKGTAKELSAFPDRTLLLCWPPRNGMAINALKYFRGERLATVMDKSCCANKAFFNELEHNWVIEYSYPTQSWSACHIEMFEVYRRKSCNQS